MRNYGVDLTGRFQDDQSALQHLAMAYQQNQQNSELARYGQEYLRNASEFQAWQRARQEEQTRLQQNQNNWWKAPEWDASWANQIMRDSQGNLVPAPGAPVDVVQKFTAFANHQRQFMERFSQDPIQAIRPGIEQVAQQVAQQIVEERMTAFREQNAAQSFVQEHSGWLHARDQQGNVIADPRTGRPALSDLGQRFLGYVNQAQQIGLRDVASQQAHALGLVQRDYALAQMQAGRGVAGNPNPATPPDPAAAARQNFLQQNSGNPPTPAVPAPQGNVNGNPPPPSSGPRGLAEMLMRDLAAQGFQPGQMIS